MGRDWQKEPFTELKVVDTNTCGQGFEPVYEKTFYGLDVACDCLGIFDRWIPYDNTFILESRGCIYNETRAGCTDADPMMPYYMNRIQDKLLCGKVGSSLPYANITRVDPTTLNCTDGLVECIDRTVPDYTPDVQTCIDPEKGQECPITDIKFVSKTNFDARSMEQLEKNSGASYSRVSFNDQADVIYSTELPKRPLTNLKMHADTAPCKDPYKVGESRKFYPSEINKDDCDRVDTRYEQAGDQSVLPFNLRQLHEFNDLDKLIEARPSSYLYFILEEQSFREVNLWNMPTWSWDLECEGGGDTREAALEQTQISLEITDAHLTIYRNGMSLIVMYGIALSCFCCASCCSTCGGDGKIAGVAAALFYCSTRLCWLIIGSILITNIGRMREAAQANYDIATEFEVINKCADSAAYVDIGELQQTQQDELDKIQQVFVTAFTAFVFVSIELTVLICGICGVCCLNCLTNGAGGRNFDSCCEKFGKQFIAYFKLYGLGG